MQVCFEDNALKELYYEEKGIGAYPDAVVSSFFRKLQIIKSAKNQNDLRSIKGNHFEKLKNIENTYSIRLNDQYRLIFGLNKDGDCTIVAIREISKHYE